jgi:integrase
MDALLAYAREHEPRSEDSRRTKASNLRFLARWAGSRTLADVTAQACKVYASQRPQSSARRELETLSAAINHFHKWHGPLDAVPVVALPDKLAARDGFLTRSDAARLLAGALGWDTEGRRHRDKINRHVARFILIGLYTGSRHRTILALRWSPSRTSGYVDLTARVLHRKGADETETSKRRPKIRIGSRLLAHLRRWRRLDRARGAMPKTIVHRDGAPYTDKLRRPWADACALAGLDVSPHILRHTRATWMMQRGDNPFKAAGFLGMSLKVLENTYGHHHPDFQEGVSE